VSAESFHPLFPVGRRQVVRLWELQVLEEQDRVVVLEVAPAERLLANLELHAEVRPVLDALTVLHIGGGPGAGDEPLIDARAGVALQLLPGTP